MEWWDWCDGTAALRGVDLEALFEGPADRALNVLWTLLVDQLGGGLVSPYQVLQELVAAPAPGETPTLATWGTSADAQAGQDAMMRMLG